MTAYIEGVGWYRVNEVTRDWRGRHPIQGRRFPPRLPLLYYGPGWTLYTGPEDVRRCYERIVEQEKSRT